MDKIHLAEKLYIARRRALGNSKITEFYKIGAERMASWVVVAECAIANVCVPDMCDYVRKAAFESLQAEHAKALEAASIDVNAAADSDQEMVAKAELERAISETVESPEEAALLINVISNVDTAIWAAIEAKDFRATLKFIAFKVQILRVTQGKD